jgi:hypothetical protein
VAVPFELGAVLWMFYAKSVLYVCKQDEQLIIDGKEVVFGKE